MERKEDNIREEKHNNDNNTSKSRERARFIEIALSASSPRLAPAKCGGDCHWIFMENQAKLRFGEPPASDDTEHRQGGSASRRSSLVAVRDGWCLCVVVPCRCPCIVVVLVVVAPSGASLPRLPMSFACCTSTKQRAVEAR